MKYLILIVGLCAYTLTFSQKVKVKKDKILIDKVEVASLEVNENTFKVTDLKDKNVFIVGELHVDDHRPSPAYKEGIDFWMEVGRPDRDNWNGFDYIAQGGALNSKKVLIARNLVALDFVNKYGLDKNTITDLLTEVKVRELPDEMQLLKEKKSIVEEYNVFIEKNGIYKGGKDGELVGYIKKNELTTTFFDINDVKIATRDNKFNRFTTGNGKSFETSRDPSDIDIVKYLVAEGFEFGNQVKEIIQEEKADLKAEKIEESGNFYDIPGYIISKDGVKRSGEITLEFEDVSESNVEKLTNTWGKVAKLKYTNEKGKTKWENFKSKDGVRIVLDNGVEYIGVVTEGSINVQLDNSFFYEIIDETDNYFILKDSTDDDVFAVWMKGNKKAMYLYKTNKEKLQKLMNTHLNCPALVAENYDTFTLEGVKKLMTDYDSQCK